MTTKRKLLFFCIIFISLLVVASCQQAPVRQDQKNVAQESKREKITLLTDEAMKPFVGKTVGELLESIDIKQEKRIYFQEPPGLWAGCTYYFANEQGVDVFVDDFQFHNQRDKKSVPQDAAFAKEVITGYRIFEWER